MDIQVNSNDTGHPSLGASTAASKQELRKIPALSPPPTKTLSRWLSKAWLPLSTHLRTLNTSCLLQTGWYLSFMDSILTNIFLLVRTFPAHQSTLMKRILGALGACTCTWHIQLVSSFIGSYVLGGYLVSPRSLSIPLNTSLAQLS